MSFRAEYSEIYHDQCSALGWKSRCLASANALPRLLRSGEFSKLPGLFCLVFCHSLAKELVKGPKYFLDHVMLQSVAPECTARRITWVAHESYRDARPRFYWTTFPRLV